MEFTEFEYNDNWKIKRFPCSCCLVKPICNDYITCDMLEQNAKKIFKIIQKEKRCPDCGEPITPIDVVKYNIRCYNYEHFLNYHIIIKWDGGIDNDWNISR